jgi:hypothetical protein
MFIGLQGNWGQVQQGPRAFSLFGLLWRKSGPVWRGGGGVLVCPAQPRMWTSPSCDPTGTSEPCLSCFLLGMVFFGWNLASRQSVQADWLVAGMHDGYTVDTCRLTSNLMHTSAAHAPHICPYAHCDLPCKHWYTTPSSLCCKTLVALSTQSCKLLMVCKTIGGHQPDI